MCVCGFLWKLLVCQPGYFAYIHFVSLIGEFWKEQLAHSNRCVMLFGFVLFDFNFFNISVCSLSFKKNLLTFLQSEKAFTKLQGQTEQTTSN